MIKIQNKGCIEKESVYLQSDSASKNDENRCSIVYLEQHCNPVNLKW